MKVLAQRIAGQNSPEMMCGNLLSWGE